MRVRNYSLRVRPNRAGLRKPPRFSRRNSYSVFDTETLQWGASAGFSTQRKPRRLSDTHTSKRTHTPPRRAESGAFTQHNHGKQPYNEGRVASAARTDRKENARMIPQWIDKLVKAIRSAVDRSTTMDEIIFGAILAFVLLIILTSLGLFD